MNIFTKKRTLTGKVYKAWEHKGWGNNISWSDYEKGRVVGWLSDKPKENDEIQFEMIRNDGSKVITRFIVLEIEHARDPRDMFWATVKPFGYDEFPIGDKSVREAK